MGRKFAQTLVIQYKGH